jgi:hypothetical protein
MLFTGCDAMYHYKIIADFPNNEKYRIEFTGDFNDGKWIIKPNDLNMIMQKE